MNELELMPAAGSEEVQVIHRAEILGKPFDVYGTFENPLILAKDVAERIEHSDVSTMMKYVDDDEKLVQALFVSGQKRDCWFLTENGVYEILMLSRKQEAKKFKKQVKSILREVRTKGGYMTAKPDETPEELCLRAMNILQETVNRQKAQLTEQARQLQLQAPDVEYCRSVLSVSSLMTVNTIAAHLGVSAKKLNAFLDGEGWIYRQGRCWYPSCKIRNHGYCGYETVKYFNSAGEECSTHNLKWTEKGRRAVIELWNKQHNASING